VPGVGAVGSLSALVVEHVADYDFGAFANEESGFGGNLSSRHRR